VQNEKNHRDNQQKMYETARNMERGPSEQPHNQKDEEDDEKQ